MSSGVHLEHRDLIRSRPLWLKMTWPISKTQASFVSFPTVASGRGCCRGVPAYRHTIHSCMSTQPLQPWRRTMVRLMDMQSFRDGFRALFLPGCVVVTLSLPLVSMLLLTRTLDFSAFAERWRFHQPEASKETAVLLVKLLISIAIDLIGDGSFLLPGLGEGIDFLWAPIPALLVHALYGSNDLAFNQPPAKTETGELLTDRHASIRTDRKQ